MKAVFALLALVSAVSAIPKVIRPGSPRISPYSLPQVDNSLTCAICVDVVTDLDEFLTSDTTEQQIVEFVEQVSCELTCALFT